MAFLPKPQAAEATQWSAGQARFIVAGEPAAPREATPQAQSCWEAACSLWRLDRVTQAPVVVLPLEKRGVLQEFCRLNRPSIEMII